jgi:hypothetical protein
MESITLYVADIGIDDRQALEHVVGQQLSENQQVVIHIVSREVPSAETSNKQSSGSLPEWCNVYEGLSDQQVSELEQVVLNR